MLSTTPNRTKSRILVVDDVLQNLQVVGTMLRNEGYDVMPAGSGPQALERVRVRPSVAAAFTAAAQSMQGFEMIPQLVESGLFKREYRDHRLEWMIRSGGLQVVLEGLEQDNIRFNVEPT